MSFPNTEGKQESDSFFTPDEYIKYVKANGRFSDFIVPKGVIFTYNSALFQYIVDTEDTIEVEGFLGKFLYLKKYNIGVSGKAGIGPSGVSTILEELIALGTKEFISIGTAGGLQKHVPIGDFVVCTKAIRDEGVSHHYFASEKYTHPSEELTNKLKNTLDKQNILYTEGPTWTIDAPYRETIAELKQYQAEGVLTVEMEASALMAIAQYRNVSFATAFVVSDSLADLVWDPKLHSTDISDLLRKLYHSAVDTLKEQ
jgi:uridine phosphorylase